MSVLTTQAAEQVRPVDQQSMVPVSPYRPGIRDTIMHALARAVENYGDDLFINLAGTHFTYRDSDLRSTRLAHALAALGVSKGETVVSVMDTNEDCIPLWFAINKLGAIWVPINTAYKGEFLRHQVADSSAKLIVCDSHYLERVTAIADQLPEAKLILCRNQTMFEPCAIPIEPFDDHRGHDETPLPIVVEPQDLASLIYTSGTTGPSKGCMISHNFMCMQGRQQRRGVPQAKGEIGWFCVPLFHAAALNLIMGTLVDGLAVAVWPRFSLSSFWDDIEASQASNALVMGTIAPLVAHAPDSEAMKRCYGQLKMIFGQPITPAVRKIWQQRFGTKIACSWSYGQTEGVRIAMVLPGENPPETCCGRPADEFEVMIFDENDQPVPEGTVGEIVFRPREANIMFEGYWRRPEQTAKVWRNLWMHTGDLARMENGYLFFADRIKDYLRNRGENVSSFELERAFSIHPAVEEIAIHAVGVQDAEDEIKATIVLRADADVDHRRMCEWAIANLPHFAVPRYFEFRTELIKNPTGRVLKYKLREEGVTADTWDREAHGIIVRRQR